MSTIYNGPFTVQYNYGIPLYGFSLDICITYSNTLLHYYVRLSWPAKQKDIYYDKSINHLKYWSMVI